MAKRRGRHDPAALIGKLALSAASTILVRESAATYLLGCAAMLTFFLHVNNQREQDEESASCNVRSVRLARSMLLTCALWARALAGQARVANARQRRDPVLTDRVGRRAAALLLH